MEIQINAPIVPGESLGGISLGATAREVLPHLEILSEEKFEDSSTRYETEFVDVWIKDGIVTQICAFEGYMGKIKDRVGIGSTLKQVIDALGPLEENSNADLIAIKEPGVCFETLDWEDPEENQTDIEANHLSVVSEIFVVPLD